MVRNRKVWGVLGLLLALAVVVGYGQPQPVPEPSLDVYAVRLEKEIHIFVTLLLQGQLLTAPVVAETITAELQDRSGKILATQRFANIPLAGTTQLIMATPPDIPPYPPKPPQPVWLLKVTAVVGGRTYSGETTVMEAEHIPPPPAGVMTTGWVHVGPPFAQCGTGRNWASNGYQECDSNAGTARLFENGTRIATGEGWAWFSRNYLGRATQIRVVGSIRGEIEKPSGQPESSVILYAFIRGFRSNGSSSGLIGGVVWTRNWDSVFNETFNRTFSGTLPPNTTYVNAYVEVRAKARDQFPLGANGWARVDELRLTEVSIYFP